MLRQYLRSQCVLGGSRISGHGVKNLEATLLWDQHTTVKAARDCQTSRKKVRVRCQSGKRQVSLNLRVFISQLARHSIASGEVLHRRLMATTGACNLCSVYDTWNTKAILDQYHEVHVRCLPK